MPPAYPVLPNVWYYFVFHLLLVFPVTVQPFFQNLFFILYPPGNQRDVKQHYKERKGRSKYQRHHQEEDRGGHIHRMPDNAVEACVDNLLILLHLDGP